MPPTCGHAFPHLCGAVSAALVGGLLAQLADGVVGAFGGLATVGCRRAETTAAAAASRLGQHLARDCVYYGTDFRLLFRSAVAFRNWWVSDSFD